MDLQLIPILLFYLPLKDVSLVLNCHWFCRASILASICYSHVGIYRGKPGDHIGNFLHNQAMLIHGLFSSSEDNTHIKRRIGASLCPRDQLDFDDSLLGHCDWLPGYNPHRKCFWLVAHPWPFDSILWECLGNCCAIFSNNIPLMFINVRTTTDREGFLCWRQVLQLWR